MTAPEPRRGLRFVHARQRVAVPGVPVREWPYCECEVTRVTRTTVYIRNEEGARTCVDRDRFPAVVREVLP